MTGTYWERKARPELGSVIEGWAFSKDSGPHGQPVSLLPDGRISLLFAAPVSGEEWVGSVVGASTRPSRVHDQIACQKIQVCLSPGVARAILGGDLHEVRDQEVALEEFWGTRATRLFDALCSGKDWRERTLMIEAELARSDALRSSSSELVRDAVSETWASKGRMTVRELCARLDVHPRQLERCFREHVGVSPKMLSRLARFHGAREELRRGGSLALVAHAAGYSDHAHMTRDFQTFADQPPSSFRLQR